MREAHGCISPSVSSRAEGPHAKSSRDIAYCVQEVRADLDVRTSCKGVE